MTHETIAVTWSEADASWTYTTEAHGTRPLGAGKLGREAKKSELCDALLNIFGPGVAYVFDPEPTA